MHASLSRDGTRKKNVVSFAKKKAKDWLSKTELEKGLCESFSLLWEYMAMLVKHNGAS